MQTLLWCHHDSWMLSNISPAPLQLPFLPNQYNAFRVFIRPPLRYTYHSPSSSFLVSIASTTNWLPNSFASSLINCGFLNAAVFTDTLSAPLFNNTETSSTELTPPPTVKGILTCRAIRLSQFTQCFSFFYRCSNIKEYQFIRSLLAYNAPSSTGSPASRRSTKLVPFTVRPSLISRQGMILLVSINYVIMIIVNCHYNPLFILSIHQTNPVLHKSLSLLSLLYILLPPVHPDPSCELTPPLAIK